MTIDPAPAAATRPAAVPGGHVFSEPVVRELPHPPAEPASWAAVW